MKNCKELCRSLWHIRNSAGTIIPWVPRPNKNAPTSAYFDHEAWIECNGIEKCESGRFRGQSCSDLSDRVLVGAGKTGQLLDLKDASLPDHAHRHTHGGSQTIKVQYRTGPRTLGTGKQLGGGSGSLSNKHGHTEMEDLNVNVDYSKMNAAEAFISRITNPKVSKSTAENDLYSPHMRVLYMFKCF